MMQQSPTLVTTAQVEAVLAEKGGEVATIEPDRSVIEAVWQMNERRIGSMVVARQNRIEGIFTERDVLERVMALHRNPFRTTIDDVMTSDVVWIAADASVDLALAVMAETRYRHLPVLRNGELCGLLSAGDLTRWILRHQQWRIDDLIRYITAG